jgi:putative ABC transport system ATP-binding protein
MHMKDKMHMICTHNLVKDYVNGPIVTKVLHGINFCVEKGELVAVTGPSGSGKSTLLYQLGLIDNPTSGEVKIEGRNVSGLNDREKQEYRLNELGFVFQDYALVPELSAAENVMVPMIMKGYSKAKAYGLAKEHLILMGLGDRLKNLPSQLSGGEQQRVSVARAVAHEPKILFADEPTASLDSTMSTQVMEVLVNLNKKEGQTIVLVTHEMEYAQLADRIVILRDGHIVDDGNGKDGKGFKLSRKDLE